MAFLCPVSLAARGFHLRAEAEADLVALRRLFVRHRWEEFASLPWEDSAKEAFLGSQFDIQHRQYAAYPCPQLLILADGDGLVGRLYLAADGDGIRLVDITLDPDRSGQGIGGALLTGVQDWAGVQGRIVSLHVDKANSGALALYLRLGFRVTGDAGLSWAMAWAA
jgi:GNAT superfamily N-acetyltransferase